VAARTTQSIHAAEIMVQVSPHVATIITWIGCINKINVDCLHQIMSPNFTSHIGATSLGFADSNLDTWITRLGQLNISYGMEIPTPDNIIEDGNNVAVWTHSNGTTAHGFPWTTDYAIRFVFDKNEKIVNITQWFDSLLANNVLTKEQVVADAKNLC